MLSDLVMSTAVLKTLDFLAQNHRKAFHVREIGRRLPGCSVSSIDRALRELAAAGMLRQEHVGRNLVSRLDPDNPIGGQYRILSNLLALHELVLALKKISSRVVLFGSRADGTNDATSDYDLFIVSSDPEKVTAITQNHTLGGLLKPVVVTPAEALRLPERDREFQQEIENGVVLWRAEQQEGSEP